MTQDLPCLIRSPQPPERSASAKSPAQTSPADREESYRARQRPTGSMTLVTWDPATTSSGDSSPLSEPRDAGPDIARHFD